MPPPSMINSFKRLPVQLFRVNNGRDVKLRDFAERRSRSYDILAENGKVFPKALNPSTYKAPNGASMRPLGRAQSTFVENIFKGRDMIIYAVPQGTDLPQDLILVHERGDHYSLQPATEMSLQDLDWKITNFLIDNAVQYDKEQWLDKFQRAPRP